MRPSLRDLDLPPQQAEGVPPPRALPVGGAEGKPRLVEPVVPWGRSTRNTRQRRRNGARPPPPRTVVRSGGGTEQGDPSLYAGARLPRLPPVAVGKARHPFVGWVVAERLEGEALV